ncbi:HU family DNA-binding protein [Clostridium sp. WB02_MRS01]|uniref:HU family DNA-binding protein n=1 Tax=Clostridium sp. WB02_MRS01 TaxID=2605777 RepID=UPI0012B1F033|nr:HU family DNA-binding protein [Clostridium sp. WB02_MRS01]MSS07024.1 HU family DNA-binding protein [Clostridium sp. WB02_MRS01]
MNKTELVTAFAERMELTKKDAEQALAVFTDIVTEELVKGERVAITGFGTFEVANRAEREGRNPKTGEPMTIAATKAPKFKAGKLLKDAVKA